MRTIRFLLQKEFLQIFRTRTMVGILFVMPIIQLIVLAHAATFDVKNVRVGLVDDDGTPTSRRLVERFRASEYFTLEGRTFSEAAAADALTRRQVDLVVHVPRHFERELQRGETVRVQLGFDGENAPVAGVAQSYALQVVERFNRDVRVDLAPQDLQLREVRIRVVPAFWYNPELDYQAFMVPGILVLLVTIVGMLLSSMNIVREKEIGTIEQLNVTPIEKSQFIVGKLLPFWIIALVELALGLAIAWLLFRIPMEGSLSLIFGVAALYLLVVLGLGLWVSTVTETQQQAMFISWFCMVIFILMSGLFTPIESMPTWAQRLTLLNPVAYFVEIMRRVLLKGAGFGAIQGLVASLIAYAGLVLSLAVWQYRKVSA